MVLEWINKNTAEKAIIFSAPENNYYIQYLAKKAAFSGNPEVINSIFTATYIDQLFPLLEENKIKILYITKQMKEQLPTDYGLLFLLKNERFKLVHSQGETEVWAFKE